MAEGRVGVLGGTFDPVHLGHLRLAETAREQLGLGRVLFIPAGQPWRKSDRQVTPVEHRVAMVRLAIGGEPAFEVCSIEAERQGPSYTAETLERLAQKFPGEDLVLILGEDALQDMPNWRDPERILELAVLAVAPRDRDGLAGAGRSFPDAGDRVVWLEMAPVEISSSEIRKRIELGDPIDVLVAAQVQAYIRDHGLYRG
jgi:nicotinate-nucleotide adenylyltransferase